MPPSEIRKDAREALKGKWKKAVFITLAFLAFSILIGFVQGLVEENSIIYNVLEIVFLIIDIPLSFGLLISFTKLKRNEDVGTFDFFKEGFSRFGKSWGIWFHTFIRLLLPAVCMVLSILLLSSLAIVNMFSELNTFLIILGTALFIASIVYAASRALLYAIAYNISFDNPDLSSKECVKKSEELMKGNRGNYLLLELSFIGWIFLALFTFAIGMLWLMPYIQVSVICFYERVAKIESAKTESSEEVKE